MRGAALKKDCTCRKPQCRPGRPLCRARRLKSKRYVDVCECGTYGFPHRKSSGRCGDAEAMWALLYGPAPERKGRFGEDPAVAEQNDLEKGQA